MRASGRRLEGEKMKHMPGYDFVVFAYLDGAGDGQPGERIREKVPRLQKKIVPHGNQREASVG